MSGYSPMGSECTYCGNPFCDGCILCCCDHPNHTCGPS